MDFREIQYVMAIEKYQTLSGGGPLPGHHAAVAFQISSSVRRADEGETISAD